MSEYWSIFKFQPLEDSGAAYKDDYRIEPKITDLTAYIFQKSVSATGEITVTYSKGFENIELQAALPGLSAVSALFAGMAAMFLWF